MIRFFAVFLRAGSRSGATVSQAWKTGWMHRKSCRSKMVHHLAILDWMMPGIDGIEVCRRIRSRDQGPYRYVPLLAATDDKQDVVAGLVAGADDCLTKPFDVDELRARVRAGERIPNLPAALLRAHTALQFEAAHDRLTAIWNRGAILDLLIGEMERSRRYHDSLGIIMADFRRTSPNSSRHYNNLLNAAEM